LKWPEFDEDQDMQRSIHLDFLYDTLQHATEKGFTWDKVATCVNYADQLVGKIKGKYS